MPLPQTCIKRSTQSKGVLLNAMQCEKEEKEEREQRKEEIMMESAVHGSERKELRVE